MNTKSEGEMNIITLDTVNSTNLYAKENIEKLADKTVIIAKKQTDGRGRFSRKWVDFGAGNLFMTIVLKPSDSFRDEYTNLTQLYTFCDGINKMQNNGEI